MYIITLLLAIIGIVLGIFALVLSLTQQGRHGPDGLVGNTGSVGPTGGLTGNTGLQGPNGQIGTDGHTGPTGAMGNIGFSAPVTSGSLQGPDGPQGYTGSMGYTGEVGITGTGSFIVKFINMTQNVTIGNNIGDLQGVYYVLQPGGTGTTFTIQYNDATNSATPIGSIFYIHNNAPQRTINITSLTNGVCYPLLTDEGTPSCLNLTLEPGGWVQMIFIGPYKGVYTFFAIMQNYES